MIHEIHCQADHFAEVAAGRKSFIMQKDTDAQYQVGDFLALNEMVDDPAAEGAVNITGRCCLVEVVHIYTGVERYLQPGTIVMSIRPCGIMTYSDVKRNYTHDVYEVDIYGATRGRA